MQKAGLYKHLSLNHRDMTGFSLYLAQKGKKENNFKQTTAKVAEWIYFVNLQAGVPMDKVSKEINWDALKKKDHSEIYFKELLFKGRISVGTCRKRGNAILRFCDYLDWEYSGSDNNVQKSASKTIRTIMTHITSMHQHQERATVRNMKFHSQLQRHKGDKKIVFTMSDLLQPMQLIGVQKQVGRLLTLEKSLWRNKDKIFIRRYIMHSILILTGHRPAVVVNMTVAEFNRK